MLDELHAGLPATDVLVVDDGSTDGTAEIARAHGAEVLSFGENRGLRAGIAAGYAYADEHGYEFVGRVDADGQHPVDELARLLEIVRAGQADVAVGSRFATGDGYEAYRYEPTSSRRLGTSVLRRAMRAALGRPFLDATSGMYAANRQAMPLSASRTRAARPRSSRSSASARPGLDVVEVPVHMRERASGESKLRGSKAVEARRHRRRDAHRVRRLAAAAEERHDARSSRCSATRTAARPSLHACARRDSPGPSRRQVRTTSFSSRAGRDAARPLPRRT